jgi:hypothetical protein
LDPNFSSYSLKTAAKNFFLQINHPAASGRGIEKISMKSITTISALIQTDKHAHKIFQIINKN